MTPHARRLFLTVLFALCLAPRPALAWGPTGHQCIAQIAQDRLSPEALAAVTQLLGEQSLADVATWADEVRRQEGYEKSGPWHYMNPPADAEHVRRDQCPEEGCVLWAVDHFAQVLRDGTAPLEQRREALRFLVHFVGDIHQPLHVGLAHDRGGNDVRVEFQGNFTNLHKLWDSGLIHANRPGWSAYAAELESHITPERASQWSTPLDAEAWADESHQLAVSFVYSFPKEGTIDAFYSQQALGIIDARLAAAGVRLAALLNDIYRAP